MATTSLAEQLKKLAVPQSSIYKEKKKKASLLFSPDEAAQKDRDTFFEIGVSGLKELIALCADFKEFEDTLFSISSKDFERAVQSKSDNENLDENIEKFLLLLSPYILLQSSHKALEWLINRYHIHQYNQKAIMMLILPYHETKIFVRFLQILPIGYSTNIWNWLTLVKKHGVALTKQILFNQCCLRGPVMKFISDMTCKYVDTFGPSRASQLNTVYAFFCSASIGAMNTLKQPGEHILNVLLPTILKALDSPIQDFCSAGCIVLGFYMSRAHDDGKAKVVDMLLWNELIFKLFTGDEITYEKFLLVNLIYTSHERYLKEIPEEVLNNISPDVMQSICSHINALMAQNIQVMVFVRLFLKSVLKIMQSDTDEFKRFAMLPEMLIDEVNFRNDDPEQFIVLILNSYKPKNEDPKAAEGSDGDGSDLEIVEETGFSSVLQQWYSKLLQSLDTKYPDHFDKAYLGLCKAKPSHQSRKELSGKVKRKLFSKLLTFKAELAHNIGDLTLFEAVHDHRPNRRADAYNYVLENYHSLKVANPEFLKDVVMRVLCDDELVVVQAALKTPLPYLSSLLSAEELSTGFMKIVARDNMREYASWMTVTRQALQIFCACADFPISQDTVLSIMPHLFPFSTRSSVMANMIANSPWGKKFELTKSILPAIAGAASKDHFTFCAKIFNRLCVETGLSFDFLDASALQKHRLIDVCYYLLLKSQSFGTTSAEDLRTSLNILLEAIETRSIVRAETGDKFDDKTVNEFINLALQDKVMFEFVEFVFGRMIDDMSVEAIPKPWCDFCGSADAVLVRQLYEICVTGCFIEAYSTNYSALLMKLFNRFCADTQGKYEFLINFAYGNILYAADPKDVISPELQLRTLVLIKQGMEYTPKPLWSFSSDALVLGVLFGLSNTLPQIRKITLDIMTDIIATKSVVVKRHIYHSFMVELLKHKEEMEMDHEQLSQVLYLMFSHHHARYKIYKNDALSQILQNLDTAPVHVAAELLNVFGKLNNAKVFSKIVPYSARILQKMESDKSPNFVLDIYESKMLRNILSRLDERTVEALDAPEVWNNIAGFLCEYRDCILESDFSQVSPAVILLKQINYAVFKQLPGDRATEVLRLISKAGTLSGNPNISSVAAKTIKKIHLNYEHFHPLLQIMLNVEDPAAQTPKQKNSSTAMLSYQLTETPEWKTGVAILEYVQSKKKMTVDNRFVLTLFQILNRCHRFEEQSYVEYTKQLILSSLWFYCNNLFDKTDKEQSKALISVFDVELIVQCIRNTQNPQTHHHALILLSHASSLMPDQVLLLTMEIFTFMGSSVLRHDDAYSFQIIIKIIETLVPILIKLEKSAEEYSGKQLALLQKRVVPVLRIFADAVLSVPEHRRLPLFKKLIETVGASNFMWVFLALLLETHVNKFTGSKDKEKQNKRSLADQESPINRPDFGQSILLEFPPEACFENFTRLITYIKTLPLQKDEDSSDTKIDPTDIFSVNGHTAIQLRHYKYTTIAFMNSCLSSPRFIQHVSQGTDPAAMETQYKAFIINVLTYIQSISKITDEKTAKYWRVMLHHSYDLLDHTNNLLSVNMFLSVVRGLLKHNLQTVRRKAMELLNSKIQFSSDFFADCDKDLLLSLLPALLEIVKTIDAEQSMEVEEVTAAQELELNQQTALLSLKLLTRMLAADNPEAFKPVLESITTYTCSKNISGNVMASVVLCLAELCGNLKAHALVSLWKFMPALIKVLKAQRQADTPELILLSTVTAVAKIVEGLPLFLSPYLQKILVEYSILLAKWQGFDQDCTKVSSIVSKLMNIKKKIANCIPPRVLIPVVNQTHQLLLDKESYDAIGPVMSVLADSFANVTAADFATLQQDLVSFFLSALQLRGDAVDKGVDKAVVDAAEDEVVNALVCLVLKLSESNFRPFYFKVYDWAIRSNVEGQKDRAITFYRLSSAIAEKLKGLFVLFAGHFIKNASELLDACNNSKTEDLYFESEEKCIDLVNSILKTLKVVFLYDSQNFLNKERFETLMQSIVDQLENTLGGIEGLKTRAKELIIPCITQFAVATADDSLWKLLNYQILLKTRHNDAEIRLLALDCLVAMAGQLGAGWLPLLAESVPFLAELLEDADAGVEGRAKEAVRRLEAVLGEPLEKYF